MNMKIGMQYAAVIFDLYGTLVDNFDGSPYAEEMRKAADVLGIERERFQEVWASPPIRARRMAGHYASFEENLADICRILAIEMREPSQVAKAAQLRVDCVRRTLVPRPDVPETLRQLRQRGLRIGLISDCSWEIGQCWPALPIASLVDAPIFSCDVRLKKPDPAIYQLACERLGVRPQECLFVGDGGSDELDGARSAGMDAVLICAPYEQDIVFSREQARRWQGPRIERVSQVLDLLAARRS